MAKFKEKIEAHTLRRQGKSIKEIAKLVDVSKGTVSLWCSEIQLNKEQISKLHENMIRGGHKGRLLGAAMQRDRKLKKIADYKNKGAEEIGNLNKRDLLMVGLGLHLGEGNKTGNKFQFTNSNPDIIKAVIKWLEYFDIGIKNLCCNVLINEIHSARERDVVRNWSKITGIPINQFNRTTFVKAINKKVYANSGTYLGTLALRAYKSSELQYRILGLMENLLYKINNTQPG